MSTPQSRDLARDGHTPADPGSTKTAPASDGAHTGGAGRRGRVPEANQPGHHPDHEQDKPVEAFVAKAAALAADRDGHGEDHGHQGLGATGRRVGSPRAAGGPAAAPSVPGAPASGLAVGFSALRLEVAVPAVALVDVARRPGRAWDEIGESRTAWLARVGLLGPLGAWRYCTSVRPRLDAAERALSLAGA